MSGVNIEWDDEQKMLVAAYDQHRYRFLMSSGRIIDVIAHADTHDLRQAVIDWEINLTGNATSIEGVVKVPTSEGAPA